MDDKKVFRRQLAVAAAAIVLYVLLMNLKEVWDIILRLLGLAAPLTIGGIIAFILSIPMNGFESLFRKIQLKGKKKKVRTKLNTVFSAILTVLLVIAVFAVVGGVVFPQLVESLISIYNLILKKYPDWLVTMEEWGINTETIKEWIGKIDLETVFEKLQENFQVIVETTVGAVSSTASALFSVFTGFVFAVYILANRKKLAVQAKKMLFAFCSKAWAHRILYVATLSHKAFSKFISGQCVEAVILGTMFFIVLSILRIPYALVVSVTICLMAIIPYVGAFIGLGIGAVLIALVSPVQALIFIVVFFVLQQVEGQLIYPRVVGGSVGLPAIWTLAAALLGGSLFGIAGMLFFIPLVSVLYSILRDNMYRRLKMKKTSAEAEEKSDDEK